MPEIEKSRIEVEDRHREAADEWKREWEHCRGSHTALVQAFATFEAAHLASLDAVTRERDANRSAYDDAVDMAGEYERRALLAEQRLAIAEEALGKCRDQFDFYAREHRTAQKYAKAETNQQFADLCSETLAKLKDTPDGQ